jgi:N-acetylmuramoyl-L-alanine amidase
MLGEQKKRHEMIELPIEASPYGLEGYYRATYTVTKEDAFDEAKIQVFLRSKSEEGEKVERNRTLAATLTTIAEKVHTTGLSDADAALDTEKGVSRTLTFLKQPSLLEITGRYDDRYRVALRGRKEPAWIDAGQVRKRPVPARGRAVHLRAAYLKNGPSQRTLHVDFDFDRPTTYPLPVKIESDSNSLELTLWHTEAEENLTLTSATLPTPLSSYIKKVAFEQNDAQCTVQIATNELLWGYDYDFLDNGSLRLSLYRPPQRPTNLSENKPLQGLTFLLSAGHGGDHVGAIGAAGLRESDVNLEITRRLAGMLEDKGATIELVRDKDTYVSLSQRARIIRRSRADFMISIHNNAVSNYSDPGKARGPLTFFTHGHQLELAWNLYRQMPRIRRYKESSAPVRQRAFRVTRKATHMPGVLVECLFLSHPEDEMLLLDSAFLDTLVAGLYKGIVATVDPGASEDITPATYATNKFYRQVKHPVDSAD